MTKTRKVIIFCYNMDYDKFLELFNFYDSYYARSKFLRMQLDFTKWYCELDTTSELKLLAQV
jgi:hypothetical protein